MNALVQVQNLEIGFIHADAYLPAVKNISFNIPAAKITALIGESGSGKSITALSFMQLLPKQALLKGSILFNEPGKESKNLLALPPNDMQKLRGNKIAMIFQEPMTSLNPMHTCGAQVMEVLLLHKKISKKQAEAQTIALFEKCNLPNPAQLIHRYPHQISGGQKQRVMIAMAMSCNPVLLIADEPTTALDVRVQKNILQLLKKFQAESNMGILFITHDLALVAEVADQVLVLYNGELVEQGDVNTVLKAPQHTYTQALLACTPTLQSKGKRLPTIADYMSHTEAKIVSTTAPNVPTNSAVDIVLQVQNLAVHYPSKKNIFGQVKQWYKAVDDVTFNIRQNETVGLVGESGCGKTTLGKALLQLIKPTCGRVIFGTTDTTTCNAAQLKVLRKYVQIVFQDPYGSLNPRLTIGHAITEAMEVHQLHQSKAHRKQRAIHLLSQVNMPADMYNRYPHQFSGGQRQRICIARALALNPQFLVFDESVSALDVSVQAQVLNLINELKAAYQFTALFITHNMQVVHYISDRIMVMQQGKIIESASAYDIMHNPMQAYTQALLQAVPGKYNL